MKQQRGFIEFVQSLYLIVIALMVVGVGGWIANIVKLAGSDFAQFGGMLALRVIGVFLAPLGAVLGFF